MEKVTEAFKSNIQNFIGKSATVLNYLALNTVSKEGQHKIQILVDYLSSKTGQEEEYYSLLEFPITNEITQENVKNNLCQPTSTNNGERLIHFQKKSDDDRGLEILKKIEPETYDAEYDFVCVKKDAGGAPMQGLGPVSEIKVYTINEFGIRVLTVYAQSGSAIGDSIGNSILNGEEGKNYKVDSLDEYEFENAYYDINGILNKNDETTEEKNVETIKTNQAPTTLFVSKKTVYAEKKVLLYELQ